MLTLLLSALVTLIISFSAYLERPIDLKIIHKKHNYSKFFIKRKHWFYNAPRLLIWGLCCLMFNIEDRLYFALISIIDIVANAFLFRFMHDSLYQLIISKERKTGRGFKADSTTPLHLENSFWDTIIRDTWVNRKKCLYVAIGLKVVGLGYLSIM